MVGFDHNTSRKGKKDDMKDKRLSICPVCLKGIFRNQDYEWGRGSVLGYLHTTCLMAVPSHERTSPAEILV